MSNFTKQPHPSPVPIEAHVAALLGKMTLAEKIGQMSQTNVGDSYVHEDLAEAIRGGRVGAVLNEVNVEYVNELQRIAVEESRLGIPLLVGRDVIHGFKTVMPIPLGQAASWHPELITRCARIAAREAAAAGINWTFAPMIDIARDPRWGRIAESLGEDPCLAAQLGAAMIRGYQGDDLATQGNIAACAKHFAGYGAAESGRDYAATNIPENELRNVYLRPFKAAVDAEVVSFMTSFSDLDGVPATANAFLLRQILREEWGYRGLVVSDWDSIRQLSIHGLTANDRESAFEAASAGVDMEMHGDAYLGNLEDLVASGEIDVSLIDDAVSRILSSKFRLGLFDNPYTNPGNFPPPASDDALQVSREAALQSVVLLKNENKTLPLNARQLQSIAVIGPLADAGYEQLGTWIFDGDPALSVTPLAALRKALGDAVQVHHLAAMQTSRSRDCSSFTEAAALAAQSDIVVLCLGEESILSGEAHSRADISLPGAQAELVRTVRAAGTPVVAVIMAGRPLALSNIVDEVDAILFAWHPGTLGGPAIVDLLLGNESPSGKLPVTFPRVVGQIPLYYNHKNTGKPPSPDTVVHIDDIDANAPQLSTGMTAFHLDTDYRPLFAFGHGLSYTSFEYRNIEISAGEIEIGGSVLLSAELSNTGERAAIEVAQLYIRDLAGSVTRPVRELVAFQRISLAPGETTQVAFRLHTDDLAFYGRNQQRAVEAGEFQAWIGGSSESTLGIGFRVIGDA